MTEVAATANGISGYPTLIARLAKVSICSRGHSPIRATIACVALDRAELILPAIRVVVAPWVRCFGGESVPVVWACPKPMTMFEAQRAKIECRFNDTLASSAGSAYSLNVTIVTLSTQDIKTAHLTHQSYNTYTGHISIIYTWRVLGVTGTDALCVCACVCVRLTD